MNTEFKAGQMVVTITGERGVVFSSNGLTVVVIQARIDNIYREIGVFHHTKVWVSK